MKSTSFHQMNADQGLLFIEKPLYLLANWINNLLPYRGVDSRIKFASFAPENFEEAWRSTYPDSSPARKLSDIYWRTRAWPAIEKELGGAIHVFDTGCGQGNYSVRLWDGIKSYTGIDAKRRANWNTLEKEHPNFHFIESRSTNILPLIPPETNLFITQSAIEHFDEDLAFFEQIREFLKNKDGPAMQMHLFPAAAGLYLHLFHGVRQYTPRTISKITRLFDDMEISLTPLGGSECKKIHFKYFSWPVLIAHKFAKPTFDTARYEKELKEAVKTDLMRPSRAPMFWALVISKR